MDSDEIRFKQIAVTTQVQDSYSSELLFGLAEDGTVWERRYDTKPGAQFKWFPLSMETGK